MSPNWLYAAQDHTCSTNGPGETLESLNITCRISLPWGIGSDAAILSGWMAGPSTTVTSFKGPPQPKMTPPGSGKGGLLTFSLYDQLMKGLALMLLPAHRFANAVCGPFGRLVEPVYTSQDCSLSQLRLEGRSGGRRQQGEGAAARPKSFGCGCCTLQRIR